MSKMSNRQRAEIYKALSDARAPLRYGEVDSYDPAAVAAKVLIQPEGNITGWLPILAPGTGEGFGIFCGLLPGAQVGVVHFEGDRDNGLVLGVTPNDEDKPPSVPGGEIWAMHKSGSYLKFTNDGKVSVHGTVLISIGNLGNAVKRFVIETFESLYNGHTHGGIATGSGHSAKPDQQMDDSHMTTITKGN